MYTYVSKHWHRFPQEIWNELLSLNLHPSLSTGDIPNDFCIELIREIYDKKKTADRVRLEDEIEKAEEESEYYFACWQALDDDYEGEYNAKQFELAEIQEELSTLHKDDTLTNADAALKFLYDWHAEVSITEEDARKRVVEWFSYINEASPDLANSFISLLNKFLETYNLRYFITRVGDSMEFNLNPGVVISERFLEVKNKHCVLAPYSSHYASFQENFGGLLLRPTETNIKNTLVSSSHVVEALANKSVGKSGATLSHVVKDLLPSDVFPHEAAKDTLLRLYCFFSDSRGVRHAGTTESSVRPLTYKDAVLFSSLSILFADYLAQRICPTCGNEMSIKDGVHGKFWGCNTFPKCKGSLSVLKVVPK